MQQAYHLLKIWNNQWASPDKLKRIQNDSLAKLHYAASRSPYYQALFEKNSYKTLTLDNISELPLLSKSTVKQERSRLISTLYNRDELLEETTGGSTGTPTQICRTRDSTYWSRAAKLRTYLANGYSLFGRTAKVSYHATKSKIYHRFGIHRYVDVNFDMSTEEQVRLICETKPEFIEGYPSAIEDIARYSMTRGIRLPSPRRIFTNSESLDDRARYTIRQGFGCRPTNIYATTEAKWVAWECERHEGLHINSDLVIVEIVDDDGQPCRHGETGNIVLTDLTNMAMPFVRYAIEDVGVLSASTCSCGRTLPLIKKVYGKSIEFIELPDGRRKPGAPLLAKELSGLVAIDRYKGVQRKDGKIDLRVTLMFGKELDTADVERRISTACGGLECKVSIVSDLEKTKIGKFLPFTREK